MNTDYLQALIRELLKQIGEDPDRPGLQDTPKRVAKMWSEFMDYEPGTTDTAFQLQSTDQMVVVSGMRVWSMCEHHLLPFWCDISIGYIAEGKVLGLSKFGRIAHKHAHKLQIQERLVEEIAQEIRETTGSENVAVIATGEHLCMTMRGVRTPARMTSSSVHGSFRDDPAARAEFLELVRTANVT
jgi:GTP cyclohydrolase I